MKASHAEICAMVRDVATPISEAIVAELTGRCGCEPGDASPIGLALIFLTPGPDGVTMQVASTVGRAGLIEALENFIERERAKQNEPATQ